ncbi:nuclear transport factor 2 family protein [Aliikangiella sp. IMCC44653]
MRSESIKQLQSNDNENSNQLILEQAIANFKRVYNQLSKDNIETIESIYQPSIEFIDPFHRVNGIEPLKAYFIELYANVNSISFEFQTAIQQNNQVSLPWTMHLSHPKIKSGMTNQVRGVSLLTLDNEGLISKHHDYFDAGEMLYEHLPLIGKIIRMIKRQL